MKFNSRFAVLLLASLALIVRAQANDTRFAKFFADPRNDLVIPQVTSYSVSVLENPTVRLGEGYSPDLGPSHIDIVNGTLQEPGYADPLIRYSYRVFSSRQELEQVKSQLINLKARYITVAGSLSMANEARDTAVSTDFYALVRIVVDAGQAVLRDPKVNWDKWRNYTPQSFLYISAINYGFETYVSFRLSRQSVERLKASSTAAEVSLQGGTWSAAVGIEAGELRRELAESTTAAFEIGSPVSLMGHIPDDTPTNVLAYVRTLPEKVGATMADHRPPLYHNVRALEVRSVPSLPADAAHALLRLDARAAAFAWALDQFRLHSLDLLAGHRLASGPSEDLVRATLADLEPVRRRVEGVQKNIADLAAQSALKTTARDRAYKEASAALESAIARYRELAARQVDVTRGRYLPVSANANSDTSVAANFFEANTVRGRIGGQGPIDFAEKDPAELLTVLTAEFAPAEDGLKGKFRLEARTSPVVTGAGAFFAETNNQLTESRLRSGAFRQAMHIVYPRAGEPIRLNIQVPADTSEGKRRAQHKYNVPAGDLEKRGAYLDTYPFLRNVQFNLGRGGGTVEHPGGLPDHFGFAGEFLVVWQQAVPLIDAPQELIVADRR